MHVPQHQTAPHFMGPQLVVLLHWFNVCCPTKIRCIYPPFLILTRVSRTGHETSTGTSYCAAIVASNLVNALLYPYRTSVGLLLWRLLLPRDPAGRRTLPGGCLIEMDLYTSLLLVFLLFPLQTWSQTVQDDWTAPAAPDGSTPLQTGTNLPCYGSHVSKILSKPTVLSAIPKSSISGLQILIELNTPLRLVVSKAWEF
jgi:hypothetical protein